MHAPVRPLPEEPERLAALRGAAPAESAPNEALDRLTDFAQSLFGVTAACVTLADENRQWVSGAGAERKSNLPSDLAACARALPHDELLVIQDALLDPRFTHHPLVRGPPNLRFYVGAPLHGPGGFLIGALSLLDVRPHAGFDAATEALFIKLAAAAAAALAARDGNSALAARLAQQIAARRSAEDTLSVKTDFIETMSHEIRTPLNGIIGMTEMLMASPLRDDQAHYASVMRAAAEHLARLVNEVLNIAKLEAQTTGAAAGMDSEEASGFVAPEELAGAPISMLAGSFERPLGFGVLIAPGVPAEIAVDVMRLRQVLLNLLGNALKFTQDGGVWLEISCAAAPDAVAGTADISFAVHDTGIGIARDELPRLFARFSQLPAGAAGRYGGSGLGLAICQHLVRLMGGAISVESTQGQGSVFAFTLCVPYREATQPPPALGRRVLLVEPHPVDRRIIESQLLRLGAAPVIAADARELAAGLSQPGAAFDVLILDEVTAARLGLARALRDGGGALGRVPVFLTTSGRTPSAPAARLLPKPIAAAALRAALSAHRPAPSTIPATAAPPAGAGRALNILLVEDNEINQIVAAAIAGKLGHRVTTVAGGVAAISAVAAGAYDIVLMDMMMPDVDGPTAARAIRKLRGPQARVPIIALTANASLEHRRQCMAAGMNDFLSKPISRPRMEAALARYTGAVTP